MRNLKYIPTEKLQAIVSSHYCTGIDGRDYGPVKHELEAILWERQSREQTPENVFEDYENFLDSEGVPPVPH